LKIYILKIIFILEKYKIHVFNFFLIIDKYISNRLKKSSKKKKNTFLELSQNKIPIILGLAQ
jgi:hypothetical protein